jgi:O-acetyl-ADP-ribose deacetylase (regulator of RNase III)
MITFHQDENIFFSKAKALVCPVNTVGVMGNGLAAAFRNRYGGLYDAYKKACNTGVFEKDGYFVFTEKYGTKIVCFPTKRYWGHDSQLKWIKEGLKKLAETYKEHDLTSIAIPAIGCGKGGLEWDEVRPLITEYLGETEMEVIVLEPGNNY